MEVEVNKEKGQKELRQMKGNDAVKGTKALVEQHLGITARRGSNEENKVSKNLIRHRKIVAVLRNLCTP